MTNPAAADVRRMTRGGPICAEILAELPEWFGQKRANAAYAQAADCLPCLVAHTGSVPAGLAVIDTRPGIAPEIHLLAVRRRHHRQGIGRAVITAAADYAREAGAPTLWVRTLCASVASPAYDTSRAFYHACGFEIVTRLRDLWGPGVSAILMRKPIEGSQL